MVVWHHKLGHPSDSVLWTALSSFNSTVSCNDSISSFGNHCKHCLSGKMHKLTFNKSVFLASKPLKLVHSDVWGPAPITSTNDFRYYLVFIDEFSKFTWVYLLKNKLMCLMFLSTLKQILKLNCTHRLKSWELIVVVNILLVPLIITTLVMASSIRPHVLIRLSRMVLLRGNIDILLNVPSQCCHTQTSLCPIGII